MVRLLVGGKVSVVLLMSSTTLASLARCKEATRVISTVWYVPRKSNEPLLASWTHTFRDEDLGRL